MSDYFCSTCKREDLPETAFPTLPGGGRDYLDCRKCVAARRAPRDGLCPKVAALVDFARENGLQVERSPEGSVVSLTFRRPRVEPAKTMLDVVNNSESIHAVINPKTGRVWAGSRYAYTTTNTLKTFADVARAVRMLTY